MLEPLTERTSSGTAEAQPDSDTMKDSTAPAVDQQRLVRHCCYECGKGRGIAYTAQPWSGPCYICRRPIFCDRILTDKCLTCGDTGKVWNAPDEREEDCKNCLPNVKVSDSRL